MKNNRIVRAYDSINPSQADKQRMLDTILHEAKLEAPPRKRKRETVVYTAKAPKTSRRSTITAIAASLVLFLLAGLILVQMVRQSEDVSMTNPVETVHTGTPYDAVLNKYKMAISESWSRETCEIEGITPRMEAGSDVTRAGYAFLDLDGDGREELLIAEESVPHIDNIWDIYTTLEDGTPIQLWVDECDGGQCRLHEDNIISISSSNKHESCCTFYNLEARQLVMREMLQWEDEDTVFHTDADGNTRQMTSREGQDISYAYDIQKLNLTWLAEKEILAETEFLTGYEGFDHVVNKYRKALTDNWTEQQCEQNDISPRILDETTIRSNLGWCLLDLDDNGVDELVISDGVHLFDLYVMMPHDGGPGHLIMATGSETYKICQDGTIEKQMFFSKAMSWYYYDLYTDELDLKNVLTYRNEYEGTQATERYYLGTDEDNGQSISKEEAGLILAQYPNMELTLTSFLEQPPFDPNESEYYEPLLETYRKAIRENWGPGDCAQQGISLMVGYYGDFVEALGYTMQDLDGNGIDELIITDGTNIYDLYTIIQDEVTGPLRLINAMERIKYYLTENNQIYHFGSGSASSNYQSVYCLVGRDLVLVEGYFFDGKTDPDHPWYFYDGENIGASCGELDVQSIIDSYKTVEIPFTPFA